MRKRLPQAAGGASGEKGKPKRTAMDAALNLLAVRARAKGELDRALRDRDYSPDERASAISRLSELGYLDDLRFAKERASGLLRQGRYGERAVLEKLVGHGLSRELARAALDSVREELAFEPESAARALLERRGLLGARDRKLQARAARLLATRGFSGEVIAKLLRASVLDPGGEGD